MFSEDVDPTKKKVAPPKAATPGAAAAIAEPSTNSAPRDSGEATSTTGDSATASATTGTGPFMDGGSAIKALRGMKPPILDPQKDSFIARVVASPVARHVAFVLLSEGFKTKQAPAWGLLRPKLKEILAEGRPFPTIDILQDTSKRQRWLDAEFNITGRTQDAAKFINGHGYLWPLYVILATPENESWVPNALSEFLPLLDASIDIAQEQPEKSSTASSITLSPGRRLAAEIVKGLPAEPPAFKKLRAQLRSISIATSLTGTHQFELEQRAKQIRQLEELVAEARAQSNDYSTKLEDRETALAAKDVTITELRRQLEQADQRYLLLEARSETKLREELGDLRSKFQFQFREGLGNIKLYADRTEPATKPILSICDELLDALKHPPR